MYYVRMSLITPKAGHEAKVAAIMDDLLAFYAKQPGFVTGYKLASADETGDVGRVTVWRSEHEAEAAAQSNHNLSRRAELIPIVSTDEERSFHAADESKELLQLVRESRR
jgi:heme-degrading monooxygenase HmoA